MLITLFSILLADPTVVDKVAEEALENNQAMLESIITFHSKAEDYTQSSDGKYILTEKCEQWKNRQTIKTEDIYAPIQAPGRKSIVLSLDGLSHILYLPEYPLAYRAQKMGHMLIPGNIYRQLGYTMSDEPNKRDLSPSEMVQAGYRVISSTVEGKKGERKFTLNYNNSRSIIVSEQHNFLVIQQSETKKGYSSIAQASDIREVAPGIYVPFKVIYEQKIDGKETRRIETRVQLAEVNKPIDPSRFKLNMQPGGTMTDFTVGKAYFVDPEGVVIKENPEIKFTGLTEKPSAPVVLASPVHVSSNNHWQMVGIVAGSLLLLVAGFILLRRKVLIR